MRLPRRTEKWRTATLEFLRKRWGEPIPRFWSKVEKGKTCWLWVGGRRSGGYGIIEHNGKSVAAHRFSWELHNGPISEGLFVLHHCDVPNCVNPSHLYLGTHEDNMKDWIVRGSEEKNGRSKLTRADASKIKKLWQEGVSTRELAQSFGISKSHTQRIVGNKHWKP